MTGLRLAELRDGVWLRPDNLERFSKEQRSADQVDGPDPDPNQGPHSDPHQDGQAGQRPAADAWCRWFSVVADGDLGHGDEDLVTQLWDVESWARTAMVLRRQMHELVGHLESGDAIALAPGFVLSAEVLRHFVADPLLPRELLPRRWPGAALRRDYDAYDLAYRRLLTTWTKLADSTSGTTVRSRGHT